ncbi:MAG: aminotransferase class V-fold PLP-dependent enzyme [Bacteroidota bacterium]|jgi:cysteine desulfurase/selenocysteine lyase
MSANQTYDVQSIRNEFPILERKVKGKPLVYFDNAATAQKPKQVIDAISHYYSHYNANIHRGLHTLADEATAAFEASRTAVQSFIHAKHHEEIIFTKGTTESINLVANAWGNVFLHAGDEIIISTLEHHANIVPWQMIAEKKEAVIRVIPIDANGVLDMEAFKKMLSSKTKMVAVVHASNALGVINPVEEIIQLAHQHGSLVMIDGAQSAVHLDIDVTQLDCDFFVFSGHKIYGPTGVGVLYGKKQLLESMQPYQGGGEMIKEVTFEKTTYNELPFKFEAGTPNIADVIALKPAIDFMNRIGKAFIRQHEAALLSYATEKLKKIEGLHIKGDVAEKVSVASFTIDGIHPQDLAILLDNQGIAVRTGHHCAQPLMSYLGIVGTTRVSFAAYNTKEEIDILVEALNKSIKMLK